MNTRLTYRGYRFPPDVIAYGVWLYHRFTLSLRDVEDVLAERGVTVSYETIRQTHSAARQCTSVVENVAHRSSVDVYS